MKSTLFLLSLCSILMLSCSSPQNNRAAFQLLPAVQKMEFSNGNSKMNFQTPAFAYSPNGDALPIRYALTKDIVPTSEASKANVIYRIQSDMELPAEGYEIKIEVNKIKIDAKDKAGLFYAFVTLNQLLEDAQEQALPLPLVRITDYPKIAFRPIQWDIKHHREKESYYFDLIDELAQQKVNGIIVEFEDKLKYERRPEVGAADAFSIAQWKNISNYAEERHINVNPLVQGLGHASFILKHEKNIPLRDDPKSDWAFNPLDPETYALQFDLYLDAIKATPHGKYLHVGGDEVQTTGRNSGKSALELNLIWLNKVCAFAAQYNRIPIFWDDMPLKQAGLMEPIYDPTMSEKTVDSIWAKNEPILGKFIEQFPKNCVYMRWNYSQAESYGNGKAMDWFSTHGFAVMGATAGQTRWTLMPQRESNIDQIRVFAESSIDRNYEGLLLTLWDDDSPHFELYKRGIAAFAEYTWAGLQRDIPEFKKTFRHRFYGAAFESEAFEFIDALDEPVDHWTNVLLEKGIHRNSLVHRENPIAEFVMDLPDFDKKGAWSKKYADRLAVLPELLNRLDQIEITLLNIAAEKGKNTYSLQVYQQVIALVRYNFNALQALQAYDSAEDDNAEYNALQALKTLRTSFTDMRSQFEAVYSVTRILNKPDGFILDQDHHHHPANQSVNFDWQFMAELMFLEKVDAHFHTQAAWQEGKQTEILQ